MENSEKKLTHSPSHWLITDSLDTFRQLNKLREESGISVKDICIKMDISTSQYYRYISEYPSQKKVQPSLMILRKYAEAMGYDIQIIKSKRYVDKK